MADRIDDNADLAVAELRRKARRRLVGAIVLALAAAILLPLLLEKEPRSLGDEVSIQIPPVDNGKFVSRLTPDKGKESPPETKAAPKAVDPPAPLPVPTAAPAPGAPPKAVPAPEKAAAAEPATRPITPIPPSVADAGTKTEAPAAAASPPSAVAPPAAAAAKAAAPAAPPTADQPAPAPASAAAPASPATAPAASTPAAAVEIPASPAAPSPAQAGAPSGKAEGYIIQLAAFTDDKGANSFANKIRKLGYPAYIEPVTTKNGKMWRVRVGGYPTRPAAYEALAKLKTEGHDGLVSAAK